MSKRSFITNITPLPKTITRDVAIAHLHDHHAMIELNPLVLRHESTYPPPNASPDEAEQAVWYEITDQINYLPGGAVKGEVSYKACFYNLPTGLQTHVFAPAGVDIRSKWTVGGNQPGEPREPQELGVTVPRDSLYIKEEVDLRCSIFMSNFVKRNLKKSHLVVADKIVARANMRRKSSAREPASGPWHSASRSLENVLNWQASMVTQQDSFPQEDRVPRPLHTRNPSTPPHCSCEGATHHPICPYYHPGDRANEDIFPSPDTERRRSLPASMLSESLPSQTASPVQTRRGLVVTELYGSTGDDSCLCTGGLHEYGCPLYPEMRLRTPATSSPPRDVPTSPNFSFPRRTRTGSGQNFRAQRSGEWATYAETRPLAGEPLSRRDRLRFRDDTA